MNEVELTASQRALVEILLPIWPIVLAEVARLTPGPDKWLDRNSWPHGRTNWDVALRNPAFRALLTRTGKGYAIRLADAERWWNSRKPKALKPKVSPEKEPTARELLRAAGFAVRGSYL